jgi:FkbH-like protein
MKLLEALEIIRKGPDHDSDPLNISLVCGFTSLHLRTFLHAELQTRFPNRRVTISTGAYGDIAGSLKQIDRSAAEAIAFVLEWEDLDPRLGTRQLGGWGPDNLKNIYEQAGLRLAQFQMLLEDLSHSLPVIISLPTLPFPPLFFTRGEQAGAWEIALREAVTSFASKMTHQQRIRLVNEQRVTQLSPLAGRLDVKSHWSTGFPYSLEHASVLAGLLARLIENPIAKKGLITDLDNTLWSGIVGEVGVAEISWDLDHQSQGHGLYQQFLKALCDEGVLVAVASKNDPEVLNELRGRDDLLLPLTDVYPCDISWGSKAGAVSRILNAWNIGADSVVFVDDNALELAEVQSMFPQITCLQFPLGSPQAVYELLVQLRNLFGKSEVSAEDKIRLESIRANAAWREAGDNSVEGFSETLLEQAQAELTLSLTKDVKDSRALELINKTNQFNLNGRRFTDGAWQQYLEGAETFVLTVSYRDRFGPLGKIAVLTGHANGVGLLVETWVMSCRAFARRIEYHCLKFLFDKFDSDKIAFEFKETPRNNPIRMFFAEFLSDALPPRLEISRARFSAACPRLFHNVRELNDE